MSCQIKMDTIHLVSLLRACDLCVCLATGKFDILGRLLVTHAPQAAKVDAGNLKQTLDNLQNLVSPDDSETENLPRTGNIAPASVQVMAATHYSIIAHLRLMSDENQVLRSEGLRPWVDVGTTIDLCRANSEEDRTIRMIRMHRGEEQAGDKRLIVVQDLRVFPYIVSWLDMLSRILIGQISELSYVINCPATDISEHIHSIKRIAFPEFSAGSLASHAIASPEVDDIAKAAFELQQALRYFRAWHDNPNGGITVDFDQPMSLLGPDGSLPSVEWGNSSEAEA